MTTIPEDFIMLLDEISRAGETDVEWPLVRAVIAVQLKWKVEELQKEIERSRGSADQQKDEKEKSEILIPPLTLQRLCELLLQGAKWYKDPAKWLTALDRVIFISTFGYEQDIREADIFNDQQGSDTSE